ncbi:hypothetical protein RHGRI_013054 [Rhododendron griersonianum]|uniref:PB1 domain-containing protein n=1 Tax=Rhododendron griersonianum TaxID=479676 RepID=A0AAV6K461_9ERIC|nr:hypothetical protein RHGRI_013054 [Rhododendron griersonianum]
MSYDFRPDDDFMGAERSDEYTGPYFEINSAVKSKDGFLNEGSPYAYFRSKENHYNDKVVRFCNEESCRLESMDLKHRATFDTLEMVPKNKAAYAHFNSKENKYNGSVEGTSCWESIDLKHRVTTFETFVMVPEKKGTYAYVNLKENKYNGSKEGRCCWESMDHWATLAMVSENKGAYVHFNSKENKYNGTKEGSCFWRSIDHNHRTTFQTLAMVKKSKGSCAYVKLKENKYNGSKEVTSCWESMDVDSGTCAYLKLKENKYNGSKEVTFCWESMDVDHRVTTVKTLVIVPGKKAIYDLGIHTTDALARKSFKVVETLQTQEQPNDCVPILSPGTLTVEGCVQEEKSPDLPRVMQISRVEQRVRKLPTYVGGLTAQCSIPDFDSFVLVGRPPDQHGEGNTSTARKTPSHNVQTGMEGEPVGQNHEANVFRVFRQDFSIPPDQHGERNTSTACETPSHNVETGMEVEPVGQNQEANVFRREFPEGPTALNTENGLIIVWRSPDQLEGQTTQFTAHPNPNALVFPQSQIASTQVLNENEDRRNSLQQEAYFMGHVSESSNLAFPAYSDAAAPSQPVPMTTHMIPQTGDFSVIFQLEGQLTQYTSHPNLNVVVPPEPQIASTQMLSENMGSQENWEFFSLEEEPPLGGHVSGSVNLTVTTCDPSPSQQHMPTNHDMMPTAHVMSHLIAREDRRSVMLKVSYGHKTIKFQVPLTSRIIELKEEVKKRLKLEPSSFDFEYKDEDDGDWIFLGCDEDLTNHLQLFSNQVIRLLVVDSDASTKNICESCGSLKRKRQ